MYRTTDCNSLRKENTGQTVTLAGWINSRRDHGGVIFIDLRDREGLTQVVFRFEDIPEEARQLMEAAQDSATESRGINVTKALDDSRMTAGLELQHSFWKEAQSLRSEDVIQITGVVAPRLSGTENPKLDTGEIEIVVRTANGLKVLNKADVPPFPLDDPKVNEDLRLEYRYLDLRTAPMLRNLKLRHRIVKATRDFLDEAGFLEIETPILSNPTPEGARDFLVPSRLNPGAFYALPQAPQQYKQLLQVAGLEKYFQIARCFRDEDLRADRQPEFTQIDVEASFITDIEIQTLIEGLLARIFREKKEGIGEKKEGIEIPTPFPRMTFADAMNRFGSDKPDTRFAMELTDVGDAFRDTQFKVFRSVLDTGGVIKAINAKGAAALLSKEQLKKWEEWVKTEFGAKGLAYIKWSAVAATPSSQEVPAVPSPQFGAWESPIVKFFSESEKAALAEKMDFKEGDVLFFGADKLEAACEVLGRVRLRCAELILNSPEHIDVSNDGTSKLKVTRENISDLERQGWNVNFSVHRMRFDFEDRMKQLNFLWVVEFPLLHFHPEENGWVAVHHPFTRPKAEDVPALEAGDYGKVRAVAYDVVLNGVELGGGSIRIHEKDLQAKMFEVLGVDAEAQQVKFGHLLKAFSFGAPPHGGIALGLDRLVMLMAGAESIREVIAFPKNNRGVDLMTHSPVEVDFKQLREVYIQSTAKKS